MSIRGLAEAALLFRFQKRWLDGVLTAAVVVFLTSSRFFFLASGPWEWDETLFARGILAFDLAAHFPHPPGFPGWLAIGHLLLPLAGEPLIALQWASAAFSVLLLWPLTVLGRRVAEPVVAAAAAVLVLVAPGPWLFAERGFSSTAAAFLALSAAAVAGGGVKGKRITVFTLLVASAFLIRPILLPVLGVLWMAVAWQARPWRRLIPGLAGAAAMVTTALLVMVGAQGGWSAFVGAFSAHGRRHFSRLASNPGGFAELGLVKGLGGEVWAAVVLLAAVVGLVVWARKVGRGTAVSWAVVLTVAGAQMLYLQNRTYARYAVPVQMALAPLVAGAAGLTPPALACGGLLLAAGALGSTSLPLVREQHEKLLPGWQAVLEAYDEAAPGGCSVVVEPELHPFASYWWHLMERRGDRSPPLVLSPWAPEPWAGVEGDYVLVTVHPQLYGEAITAEGKSYGGVSAALEPLTQQRLLDAVVLLNPPLPVGRWWARESTPAGEDFMWAGAGSSLVLPPLQESASLVVDCKPASGPEPVRIKVNGRLVEEVDGLSARRRVLIPGTFLQSGSSNLVTFSRAAAYAPGGSDQRPLAVQVFALRVLAPDRPWRGAVARRADRETLGIKLEGHYPVEDFADLGEGMWLAPTSRLELHAGAGLVYLTVWAPRPTPSRTVIKVGDRRVVGPVDIGARPEELVITIDDDDVREGIVRVTIESEAYVPALADRVRDSRALGIVIGGARFEPS